MIDSVHTYIHTRAAKIVLYKFAEESLRQDEMWLLDNDDSISHKPMCRANRPDHLEFLRITPPEDDIIGETLCHPKHEPAVSGVCTQTHTHICTHSKQQCSGTVVSGVFALDLFLLLLLLFSSFTVFLCVTLYDVLFV